MYLITNGCIITEDALLEGHDILIEEGRITQIMPRGEIRTDDQPVVIDAEGGYVTPGFIDIHSDYIEHMAEPRPTCLMNFQTSLMETEKELIAHGITTMFHSLSLFKDTEYKSKSIRSSEHVKSFIELIDKTATGRNLIRHRFHARFEIDNVEEAGQLVSYIKANKVHLVSFMDHTPGQGQYRDLKIYRDMVKSYENLPDQVIDEIIARNMAKEKITVQGMREIAELAAEKNIPIASHDDDTFEKLELVQSLGACISEFPMSVEIALKAREKGMFTMAGAPNILLGGSHNGNLSAMKAIQAGSIDILCSDYYPPAMLHAIFKIHEKTGTSLAGLFRLVTINPARAVNMDQDLGSLKAGKKADLLVIQKNDVDLPVITKVMVEGRLVQSTSYNF